LRTGGWFLEVDEQKPGEQERYWITQVQDNAEEEEEEKDLFIFNDTIEIPRAPAVTGEC
jgi:hypothetical protein